MRERYIYITPFEGSRWWMFGVDENGRQYDGDTFPSPEQARAEIDDYAARLGWDEYTVSESR